MDDRKSAASSSSTKSATSAAPPGGSTSSSPPSRWGSSRSSRISPSGSSSGRLRAGSRRRPRTSSTGSASNRRRTCAMRQKTPDFGDALTGKPDRGHALDLPGLIRTREVSRPWMKDRGAAGCSGAIPVSLVALRKRLGGACAEPVQHLPGGWAGLRSEASMTIRTIGSRPVRSLTRLALAPRGGGSTSPQSAENRRRRFAASLPGRETC